MSLPWYKHHQQQQQKKMSPGGHTEEKLPLDSGALWKNILGQRIMKYGRDEASRTPSAFKISSMLYTQFLSC